MGREDMRAGDRDRQAVAEQLKTALDDGRLDLGEYDERLQRTYAAKTYADLDGLLTDLPGTVPVQHSQIQPATPGDAPVPSAATKGRQIAQWAGPYGGVIVVCVLIWLITSISSGHLTYFWPVWMLIPLAFGVFGQWVGDGGNDGEGDRKRDRRDRRRR